MSKKVKTDLRKKEVSKESKVIKPEFPFVFSPAGGGVVRIMATSQAEANAKYQEYLTK